MDSENEVIIVVDDICATNGLNGHSEDLSEMKTRSKSSEVDALKAKVRNSVRGVGGQDKAGSDTEKKDKKVIEGKPAAKDATKATSLDKPPSNSNASSVKKSTKSNEELLQPAQLLLSSKKRNLEREDDSGINSRASSVSNVDDATPRMRTRSSRSSDIASTSTPAKKGQGRMPLSTYDFEDFTFEDDISSSSGSLKRKAVLYVEEMEDADEAKETGSSEPAMKRRALTATTNFFNAFLNPLRALRGKLAVRSQAAAAQPTAVATAVSPKAAEIISKENVVSVSKPETSQTLDESTDESQTCRIM